MLFTKIDPWQTDEEVAEEEVGVGPRGGLCHDGGLRQEADARGTRSARSDQQGHVCRHGPTATGVSHRISTPRRCPPPVAPAGEARLTL